MLGKNTHTAFLTLRGFSCRGHHPDDRHQSRISKFRESCVRPLRGGCRQVYCLMVKTYPIDNQACSHAQRWVILVCFCLNFTQSRLLTPWLCNSDLSRLYVSQYGGNVEILLRLTVMMPRGITDISVLNDRWDRRHVLDGVRGSICSCGQHGGS